MSTTPIRVPSIWADEGSASKDDRLIMWPTGDGLAVEINTSHGMKHITVDPSQLAEAMSLIPGFVVKYVPPVIVPQYLGAVVERQSVGNLVRWVRVANHDEHSLCWFSTQTGNRYDDDQIAGILANGGYECEPEFPIRTP